MDNKQFFGICVSAVLLAHSSLFAESAVKDDFAESDQRKIGEKLDKSKIESTSGSWVTWQAASNLLIGEDGGKKGAVVVNNEDGFVAKLPVPDGNLIKIAADLRSTGSDDSAMSIGLGDPSPGNATWLSGIFVTLSPNGKYSVMAHPNPGDPSSNFNKDPLTYLKNGVISNFNADGANSVVLEYDKAANTLSLTINGEPCLEHVDLVRWNLTPSTAFAGFSGWHQKTESALVDSFELSVK